jgi:hypothetical protein
LLKHYENIFFRLTSTKKEIVSFFRSKQFSNLRYYKWLWFFQHITSFRFFPVFAQSGFQELLCLRKTRQKHRTGNLPSSQLSKSLKTQNVCYCRYSVVSLTAEDKYPWPDCLDPFSDLHFGCNIIGIKTSAKIIYWMTI